MKGCTGECSPFPMQQFQKMLSEMAEMFTLVDCDCIFRGV